MQNSPTVIITAAGTGSRLGKNIPKCIVPVNGKTILQRQLSLLDDFDDIRIVVGYKSDKVISHAKKIRKDILFVFNHNYKNSTPLQSLFLASQYARKKILYIDGDLLISKQSIKKIINADTNCIGITKTKTEEPVCVYVKQRNGQTLVTGFTRSLTEYEWSGLTYITKNKIINSPSFVYELFHRYLPIKAVLVDVYEIDTPQDLKLAKKWTK